MLKQTIGRMVSRARLRANRAGEGPQQISELDWLDLLWEYYGYMHALIVEKGARYFEAESTVATVGGLGLYALPDDMLGFIGADLITGDAVTRAPIRGPIPVQWRTAMLSGAATTYGGGLAGLSYFGIEGNNLAVYPPPPPGGQIRMLYIPQPFDFTNEDNDFEIDVINNHGMRFMVWGAASLAQVIGTESQDRAIKEINEARAELEYWACLRTPFDSPYKVNDDELSRLYDGLRWPGVI